MQIYSPDVEIVTDLDADVEIIEASAESGVRGEAALAGLRPKKRLHDKTVHYTGLFNEAVANLPVCSTYGRYRCFTLITLKTSMVLSISLAAHALHVICARGAPLLSPMTY